MIERNVARVGGSEGGEKGKTYNYHKEDILLMQSGITHVSSCAPKLLPIR